MPDIKEIPELVTSELKFELDNLEERLQREEFELKKLEWKLHLIDNMLAKRAMGAELSDALKAEALALKDQITYSEGEIERLRQEIVVLKEKLDFLGAQLV